MKRRANTESDPSRPLDATELGTVHGGARADEPDVWAKLRKLLGGEPPPPPPKKKD